MIWWMALIVPSLVIGLLSSAAVWHEYRIRQLRQLFSELHGAHLDFKDRTERSMNAMYREFHDTLERHNREIVGLTNELARKGR